MAGIGETGDLRGGRRWSIASADDVAGLMALSILVEDAAEEAQRLLLTRNEMTCDPSSGAGWRGRLTNVSGDDLSRLAVKLRFLDGSGLQVAELSAHIDSLEAGAGLDMGMVLPPEATGLQVLALRWRSGNACVDLGPWRPWDFGYIQSL